MSAIPSLIAKMEKKTSANPLVISVYTRRFYEVVCKEIELAGIDSSHQVLNIGCGGLPYTAIQLARTTGAFVWALDRDEEAVAAARECVKLLQMEDQIEVLTLDGTEQLEFDFEVAIVALHSEPKEEILHNLIRAGKPGARLIFRRPREEVANRYDSLPDIPAPCAWVSQSKATFDESVLYKI